MREEAAIPGLGDEPAQPILSGDFLKTGEDLVNLVW